ncbi:hypothetical protein [Mesorhizobium sp. WSM3859]|uniref:hypothetical protein n=1 Tax=Mesorhizobium sp. WSM3859 TaxID=2029402 RepID=UPI0015964F4C|nr:hypothetical protein [Mesorhizobium sp. WSM3859]
MLYLFDFEPDDFRSIRPEIIRLKARPEGAGRALESRAALGKPRYRRQNNCIDLAHRAFPFGHGKTLAFALA